MWGGKECGCMKKRVGVVCVVFVWWIVGGGGGLLGNSVSQIFELAPRFKENLLFSATVKH